LATKLKHAGILKWKHRKSLSPRKSTRRGAGTENLNNLDITGKQKV